MWTLTSKKNGDVYYLLPEKEKHSVGRANADLILTGDTSISRSHACLYTSKDSVKVIDVGSKYGTFYNENIENKVEMKKNTPIELKNGERIKFGVLENEWVLSKLNISTLTSTLTAEHKAELQNIIKALDGRIVDKWEKSCTHLTMSEITVTHKVLQALVENFPIVSIEFWRKYLANLKAGQPPPKPADYLPKLSESFINRESVSFGPVAGRKTLFAGKTFVFTSSVPFEKYKTIIESSGGACENLYKGVTKSTLTKKNVIVIRNGAMNQTQSSQTMDSVYDFIRSIGRRLIPDAEIGLAILHCSITKYCNPDYKMVNEFVAETNDVIPHSNIIAKHTPSLQSQDYDDDVIEIPESEGCKGTEKFQPARSECPETDVEIIGCTENPTKNLKEAPLALLAKTDTLTPGKRKRKDSDGNQKSAKKFNTQTECNASQRNDAPMSSNMFENSEMQLSSQPINRPQEGTSKQVFPSTSKQSTKRHTVDLSMFIDTSQITKSQNLEPVVENVPAPENNKEGSKKRARIAAICSDDDDDDLFAFDSSAPKKQKKTNVREANTRSQNSTGAKANNETNTNKTNSENTKPTKPKFQLPPKKPVEIPTDGWLSKSLCSMKIKTEDTKENIKEESLNSSAWVNSLKGGFEVRVKPMNLVSRSFREASVNGVNSNATTTSSGKNFKAFVKKCNYKPQTSVVATVPVYVGLKTHCDF